MINGARRKSVHRRTESRRLGGLLPALPEVGRAEDGRAEVAGFGSGQQGNAVTRIEHEVADDVAKEMRAIDPPTAALGITVIQPGTLARGDEKDDITIDIGG